MITRRALIKWGVVAPALVAGPQAALARFPEGLDALVVDRRHLAAGHAGLTAPKVYPIDGDVTALWYDVLDLTWRRPGFVLGGVTGRDALFVLETLALDRGRKVVGRNPLPPAEGQAEGPVAWVIAPVHPTVKV